MKKKKKKYLSLYYKSMRGGKSIWEPAPSPLWETMILLLAAEAGELDDL